MSRSARWPVLVSIVLAGCMGSESQGRTNRVVVQDSAGVTIIDNGALPPPEMGEPLVPELEIGVREGEPDYQFFRVGDIKRLDDGAIAVTNSGTRDLRIYESDGTHRATAGGAGEGPGEFRYPTLLTMLPGDTIQVQDFLDRVYFTSDGEFVRRVTGNRQALAEVAQKVGGYSEGGSWLADGSYFTPVYAREKNPPRAGPPFRPSMMLVRASSDFSTLDTLGQFGGFLQQYIDLGGGRGVVPFEPPFARNTAWALGEADGTIVVGDNGAPEVHLFHPDGTHSIVRWSGDARPVTDEEVEIWKTRQRNASWAQGRLPDLERAWAVIEIPETKPYYGRASVGSDGTLWVSTEDPGPGTTMLVFARDGRFERRMRFREQFSVYDSGPGWVLGVMRDTDDVEYVQLYAR